MTICHPGDAEGGLPIELVQASDTFLRGLEELVAGRLLVRVGIACEFLSWN